MALIQLVEDKTYYYDPDGANAPLTMQMPLSTNTDDGARVRIINNTVSATPITIQAQGSDTVANPVLPSSLLTSHTVPVRQLVTQYVLKGTEWRLESLDSMYDHLQQPNPHGQYTLEVDALNTFTAAMYGGLDLTTPTPIDDIGALWDTITEFDVIKFSTPKLITQNLTNSSLAVQYEGVYILNVILGMSHAEAQQGRTTGIRLYNLTDNTPIGDPNGIEVPIARNQPGSLISLTTPFEATSAAVNKEIVLQIGGGDSITGVTALSLEYCFMGIGEFRGSLNRIEI